MEAKCVLYDISKSAERIDEILNASTSEFSDSIDIPKRNDLTYSNGYYINVTALFIDIIGSSDLTDKHKRPILAKIYRAFISECVAVINGSIICQEINVNGDCVWGVFEASTKMEINHVFQIAKKLNSLIYLLNLKLRKKGYEQISVGIGMDYGRALMVKAGFSGSGINDVIWMGDVVNSACHLCNIAGRNGHKPLIVSEAVYINLNDDEQRLLSDSYNLWNTYHEGDLYDGEMQAWCGKHCI